MSAQPQLVFVNYQQLLEQPAAAVSADMFHQGLGNAEDRHFQRLEDLAFRYPKRRPDIDRTMGAMKLVA